LDLSHAFTRYADFYANLLKCCTPTAMQTKASFNNSALFGIKLADPAIDNFLNNIPLRASRRFRLTPCAQMLDQSVFVFGSVDLNSHAIVQCEQTLYVVNVALQVCRNRCGAGRLIAGLP
jgi:hypothetical protein